MAAPSSKRLIAALSPLLLVTVLANPAMAEMEPFDQSLFIDNGSMDDSCFNCDAGPPPDLILSMPPPPLPAFLQHLLAENASLLDDQGGCNLCHLFTGNGIDQGFVLPSPDDDNVSPSYLTMAILTTTALLICGVLSVLVIVKCRRGKLSLPDNFLRGHKTPPPHCSADDSCISPVVNEKSPHSIITSAPPMKKSVIPAKYWRRGDEFDERPPGRNYPDSSQDMEDSYAAGGSCTSSPVYAELEGGLVTHIPQEQLLGLHATMAGGPVLIAGAQGVSPYSVGLHTYSEVNDGARMAGLGSSAALLTDGGSFDNAAYLPTAANAANDNYQTRSLRRGHRMATLAQLGSATPLLTHHSAVSGSPAQAYLTGGRLAKVAKKPRPQPLAQQLARGSLQRMQELDSIQNERDLARYAARGQIGHGQGHYSDLRQSPSLTTFKSSQPTYGYNTRDSKRPLPPVPGVRL